MKALILCALLYVVDGDTLKLRCDGNDISVRIHALDCAELPTKQGYQAKHAMEELLKGKKIEIKRRGKSWNRTVAKVFADGRDVACQLIRSGVCKRYAEYDRGGEYEECEK